MNKLTKWFSFKRKPKPARSQAELQTQIDGQLASIQNSTRTSFRFFIPVHNNLRMKWQWYYLWHLNPHSSKINFTALAVTCLSFIFGLSYYASQLAPTRANLPPAGLKTATVATVGELANVPDIQEKAKGKVDPNAAITDTSDKLTVNLSDRTTRDASLSVATQNKNGDVRKLEFGLLVPKDQVVSSASSLRATNGSAAIPTKNKIATSQSLLAMTTEKAQAADTNATDSSSGTNATSAEPVSPPASTATTPSNDTTPKVEAIVVPKTITPDEIKTQKVEATGVKIRENDGANQKYSLEINPEITTNYQVTPGKLKEDIILNSPKALGSISSLDFSFKLDNLNIISNPDGSYVLKDQTTGEVLFSLPKATLTDKNGKHYDDQIKLVLDKEQNLASYQIAPDWLTQINSCQKQRLSSSSSDNSLLSQAEQDSLYKSQKDCLDVAEYPLTIDPTVVVATSTTTNPNSFSKDRTLFEATNGDMVNVYSAGAELDYKISSDHGNTWGTAAKIIDSSTTDDNGFSGWITADNKIHLVYSNNNTNSYIFYRQMTFDTATHTITSLGTEYTVEDTGTPAFPTVAQKSDGTIFVAYQYLANSGNYLIGVKASTASDGSTWSTATTLSEGTNTSAATYPALTLWNDNPAVIYNFANASLRWNYYNGSAWQSAGWTNEVIASDVGSALNQEFSISQATSDNYLHLTWKDDSVGIKYRKLGSASNPASWDGSSTAITTGASHASDKNPSIGLGLNDAIYLYYSEYVGASSYNIKYQEKVGSGGTFGPAMAVTTDNGNNLIAQSALKPTDAGVVYPASSYALSFSGSSNNYIGVASSPSIAGNFSISVWLNRTGNPSGSNNSILDIGNYGANNGFGIRMNSSNQLGWRVNRNENNYKAAATPSVGAWEHYALVYNGTTIKIYKNGSEVSNDNFSTNPTTVTNYIRLACREAGNECYNGKMDEPQIYSRALSAGDVTNLYNSGTIKLATTGNGLVAAYHFDENTGTTASDYSGNNYTLSFTGSPTWVSAPNQVAYPQLVNSASINPYSPVIFVSGTSNPFSLNYAPKVIKWTAAADGNWSDGTKWAGGVAPGVGDTALFDSSSVKNVTVTADTGALGGVYFESGYTGTVTVNATRTLDISSSEMAVSGSPAITIYGTLKVPTTGFTVSNYTLQMGTTCTSGGNPCAAGWTSSSGTLAGIITDSSGGSAFDMTIDTGGILTHVANTTTAAGETYKLVLNLTNLTLQNGGKVNVTGRGYAAGYGPGHSGNSASYGGQGGSLAATYGDFSSPTNIGSAGSGGNGGGAALINAIGTVSVASDSSILSNGTVQVGGAYYGDSGGSINLTAAMFAGSGTVSAIGNNGSNYSGGGGGGRIKVQATTSSFAGSYVDYGGNNGNCGGAGTIFTKLNGATNGTLIVDNANQGTSSQTMLNAPADTGTYTFDAVTVKNSGNLAIASGQIVDLTTATRTGSATNIGTITATGVVDLPTALTVSGMNIIDNGSGGNNKIRNSSGGDTFASITLNSNGVLTKNVGTILDVTSGTTIGGDATGALTINGTLKIPTNGWIVSNYTLNMGTTCKKADGTTLCDTGWYQAPSGGSITGIITDPSGGNAYDITISTSGILTHVANTTTETYKLILNLANLTLQNGGNVVVSYKGFTSNGLGGGSAYGGQGGNSGGSNTSGSPYGDYSNPTNIGSGGGGGAGGCAYINASGTINIASGTSVLSVGNSGGGISGGVSGGSINLTAGTFSGSGALSANGGSGYNYGLAGGGGRIKVQATTSTFSGTYTANSPNGGAPGTIFTKLNGAINGNLTIDNGSGHIGLPVAMLKSSTDTGIYTFDAITVKNNGKLAVVMGQTLDISANTPFTGSTTSGVLSVFGTLKVPASYTIPNYTLEMGTTCKKSGGGLCDPGWVTAPGGGSITGKITDSSGGNNYDITVDTGGIVTHVSNTTTAAGETYKLVLNLTNLTVQNTGKIDVSGKGYAGGQGPGAPSGYASYGGRGYFNSPYTYGDFSNPTNLGSGGSGGGNDGSGGGAVIINATGTVTNSANILSNGQTGKQATGGTVNIVATTLAGSGIIAADCAWNSGGGRIALFGAYNDTYTVHAYGNGAGTIYIKKTGQTNGDLIIKNSGVSNWYSELKTSADTGTYTLNSLSIISANLNLTQTENITVTGDTTVDSNSKIVYSSNNSGTPSQGAWPTLNVQGNLTLAGTITATGSGFVHDAGPVNGKGLVSSGNGSGGGFGGAGGLGAGGTPAGGQVYGSLTNNNFLGSGGGNANGGTGGGMIKMNITGNLALGSTGKIYTDGSAGGASGGGGSGGATQIVVSGTFSGSSGSAITANGGAGGASSGGGGGGRIGIYPTGDTYTGAKTASGGAAGSGSGTTAGASGTIQIQHGPSAPTITAPASDGATNQSQNMAFHFNSTDPDTDWLQYKLQFATDSGFTQNVSTFNEVISQSPSDGDRTAQFSNQNMTTGKAAGTDGYASGRDAILTILTPLHQGDTFYYRVYAYDPEGVDSFDSVQHWSAASTTRSFTVAPINKTAYSTATQTPTVTFCSGIVEFRIRNTINEDVQLTATEGAKNFYLSTTSGTGHFYEDGNCATPIAGNTVNIGVGGSSATFFYKDSTPSPLGVPYVLTISETPSLGWTDASQNITIKPAGFGAFQLSGYPANIVAGTPFTSPANNIVVTVKDIFGNTKNDWTGQIWFYSSDSQGVFPYTDQQKYTFTSGSGLDNGSHTFTGSGFTLKTKGNQSLVVHNSEGSDYDAIGNILVATAATDHFGLASYPQAAAGRFAMSSFSWDTPGFSAAPYNPTVTAYDAYNNVKDNFTGETWFELYRSSDTPGDPNNSTANYTFSTDYYNHYTFTSGNGQDNGSHQFVGIGFNVVSSGADLKLRVRTSDNGNKFSDFTINVKPLSIDHFGITTTPTISRNSVNYEKQVDTTLSEDVTLTAYDPFGNVKTDYGYDDSTKAGMVYFYSSDAQAVLPYTKTVSTDSSACYHLPSDDLGVHTFTPQNTPNDYFKFQSGGYQTISASECIDPASDYATNASTNKTDPRLEAVDPSKNPASTGIFPATTNTPSKVYVTTHIPGSRHTATDHSDDANDLIEAAPGYQQVTLTWTNPFDIPADQTDNPQAYIYRCDAGPNANPTTDCSSFPTNYNKITPSPNPLLVTASARTDYTDPSLTNGNHYYYKVSYAYKKQDNSYLETDKSITIDAVPADIAPREVTAVQLDRTDATNPGKIKVQYKLRWPSQVSLAYFNVSTNSWSNATSTAQSGDSNGSFDGNDQLPQYTAYFDPKLDIDGKYFNGSFKMRVKVTAQGSNAYADSPLLMLDSKNPAVNSIITDATALATVNLALNTTDDSPPIQMMVSMDANFADAVWQAYSASVSNFDLQNKTTVYFKFRDLYNNLTITNQTLYSTTQNFGIKDASTISSNSFRLILVWDRVSPTPKTYHVFRSTDNVTYSLLDTTTKNAYTDVDLDSQTTYAYKVQAEDTAGSLSIPAGPLSSMPGAAPDVTAKPTVELFGWKQDQGVRAKITWDTDQNSDSSIAYSTSQLHAKEDMTADGGGVVKIAGDPKLTLTHEIWLYNLDPATKYYFKVISKNEIQIAGYSDVLDFTTPERIVLLVSGLTISDITQTTVSVSWTTSKLSTTILEYGPTSSYGTTLTDDTWNTEHKFKLINLKDGTTYHLRVKATDFDQNTTTSDDYVFSTPAQPTISNFRAETISANTATLSWTTNVNSDSNVEFTSNTPVVTIQAEGRANDQNTPTAIQQGQQGKSDSTTLHSVTIIGLVDKTGYTATARSKDQFANEAKSSPITFTTTADVTPPVISDLKSEITSSGSGDAIKYQAIISWGTDESATSQVEYGQGVSGSYDSKTKEDLSLNQTHVIILNDLKPNSAYHARVTSFDRSANQAYSEDFSLITPPKQKQLFQMIMDAIASSFSWVPRWVAKLKGQ